MRKLGTMGVLLLGLVGPLWGQDRIISYINENGVKVYTNFPSRRSGEEALHQEQAQSTSAAQIPADARGADLFRPLIVEAAQRHQVDADLVEAIMAVESGFDPFAVSDKNCKGLMQLHPDTAKRFGVDDIFDPEQNIEGGVKYLEYLQNYFDNDLTKVVAAYNAGENAVERYDGAPPFRETRDYMRKISSRYDLSQTPVNPQDTAPRRQRVQRIELPDGRVLYTNTPVERVSQ